MTIAQFEAAYSSMSIDQIDAAYASLTPVEKALFEYRRAGRGYSAQMQSDAAQNALTGEEFAEFERLADAIDEEVRTHA